MDGEFLGKLMLSTMLLFSWGTVTSVTIYLINVMWFAK